MSVYELFKIACSYNITIPCRSKTMDGFMCNDGILYLSNRSCRGYVVELDNIELLRRGSYITGEFTESTTHTITPMQFPQTIIWLDSEYIVHSPDELYKLMRDYVYVFNRVACGEISPHNLDIMSLKILAQCSVSDFRLPEVYKKRLIKEVAYKPVAVVRDAVYGFDREGKYCVLPGDNRDTSWMRSNRYLYTKLNLGGVLSVGDDIDYWVYYVARGVRVNSEVIPVALTNCVIGYDDLDVIYDDDNGELKCVTMIIICKRFINKAYLVEQLRKNVTSIFNLGNRYLLHSGYNFSLDVCSRYNILMTNSNLLHCKFYV